MSARFTMWDIDFVFGDGVKLQGKFNLIPHDDLNEEERKWTWLMRAGHRDLDNPIENDVLDNYEEQLVEYDKLNKPVEEIEDLFNELETSDSEDDNSVAIDNVLISPDMVNRTLVDVPQLLVSLKAENCPDELIKSFFAHVQVHGVHIGYGTAWVKKTQIDVRMKMVTTPPKNLTIDQKRAALKKKEKKNAQEALEMGVGDTSGFISDLMLRLKESVMTESKVSFSEVDELEKMPKDELTADAMVSLVRNIDETLARHNGAGVRLVNLRGQIFCLYQKMNPQATALETAALFGVSASVVGLSRGVASLIAQYPMFNRVTLPFTTIVRNLARINKWLATADIDQLNFWRSS